MKTVEITRRILFILSLKDYSKMTKDTGLRDPPETSPHIENQWFSNGKFSGGFLAPYGKLMYRERDTITSCTTCTGEPDVVITIRVGRLR